MGYFTGMDNLIPGTKYVRKVSTGQIFAYHNLLEGMEGMQVFVYEEPKPVTKVGLKEVIP